MNNGIYPNLSKEGLENYIGNDSYLQLIKEELEVRSGFKFDKEAVVYMIEEWIQSKYSTIYEHAVKTGLISRLKIN